MVSGNIDDDQISLFDIFSDKKYSDPDIVEYQDHVPSESTVYLEVEDSIQSSIRIGRRIISKNHPDHFGLIILNEILGGYFGSRLMKNIREDKGYTYGIYSSLAHYVQDNFWVIGSDVGKQFIEPTLEEVFKEFKRLQEEPLDHTELETVKNYMLGNFLSSLETSFSLAGKFKKVHFFGLNYDYYDKYIDTIHTINAKRLQDLAGKYLNREDFKIVTVG